MLSLPKNGFLYHPPLVKGQLGLLFFPLMWSWNFFLSLGPFKKPLFEAGSLNPNMAFSHIIGSFKAMSSKLY